MRNFSFFLILFLILYSCSSQKEENPIKKTTEKEDVFTKKIKLNAEPINSDADNLTFLCELKNINIDSLYIDTSFFAGYDYDPSVNIYYKIKKEENGIFTDINEKDADYQYYNIKNKKILLKKGNSYKSKVNIELTAFEKNKKYKIKFFYRLSKYGNYNDISTYWIEFKVN